MGTPKPIEASCLWRHKWMPIILALKKNSIARKLKWHKGGLADYLAIVNHVLNRCSRWRVCNVNRQSSLQETQQMPTIISSTFLNNGLIERDFKQLYYQLLFIRWRIQIMWRKCTLTKFMLRVSYPASKNITFSHTKGRGRLRHTERANKRITQSEGKKRPVPPKSHRATRRDLHSGAM